MTIEQACDMIAQKYQADYIYYAEELPDAFVITGLSRKKKSDNGIRHMIHEIPVRIDKQTGNMDWYFPQTVKANFQELKRIEIPEKYRIPDEPVTLEQACDIVIMETKVRYLSAVREYPELFLITILSNRGEELLDSGCIVHKRTGTFGAYNMILRFKLLTTLGKPKELEIPEKYRFTAP